MTLDEKISLLHGNGWDAAWRPGQAAAESAGQCRLHPGHSAARHSRSADGGCRGGRHALVGVRPLFHAAAFAHGEAASWDPDLAREYGALIGRELRDQGYTMTLGGGIDLAREPRNGRNFEYTGEDPILAGKLVGAEMKALQAQHIVGDIKHYAMNDQEERPLLRQREGRQAGHARKRPAGVRDRA
jgi:beta-glucosidase